LKSAKAKRKQNPPNIHDGNEALWVQASFHRLTGYGDLSKHLTCELAKLMSIAIQTKPDFYEQVKKWGWWDRIRTPSVSLGPSLSLQPTFSGMTRPSGAPSALFTMFECDRLSPTFRSIFDQFNLVIVSNNENAMHYRNQTKTPIESVPLGINFEFYHWRPFCERDVFRFGTAGNLGHGSTRKGLFRVIEWFQDAFPRSMRDVRLSIKLSRGYDKVDIRGDDRIKLVPDDMSTQQLAAWHHSLDVYADGSTYEGWGMFPCNSLACGRPVIGTYYGGHREYFKFGNHIPIGYKVQIADDIYEHLSGAWAVPDHSEGVEAMRWCYDNRAEVKRMGQRAADSVKHLTWKNTALGVLDALSKHGIFH